MGWFGGHCAKKRFFLAEIGVLIDTRCWILPPVGKSTIRRVINLDARYLLRRTREERIWFDGWTVYGGTEDRGQKTVRRLIWVMDER
jgi:hypothetical protein